MKMKMKMKILSIVATVILSLQCSVSHAFDLGGALGDLANIAGAVNPNSDAARLKRDQQRTKNEGTMAGVVGGALLGKILGGGKNDALKGAIIGGIAGRIVGSKVAKVKKRTALTQDRLNRQIALLDADIRTAKQHNLNTQKYATIVRKKLAILGSNRNGKNAIINQLAQVIKQKQNILNQQTAKLRVHQQKIRQARNQANQKKERINTTQNDRRVVILKKEITLMQNKVNLLTRTRTNALANRV